MKADRDERIEREAKALLYGSLRMTKRGDRWETLRMILVEAQWLVDGVRDHVVDGGGDFDDVLDEAILGAKVSALPTREHNDGE